MFPRLMSSVPAWQSMAEVQRRNLLDRCSCASRRRFLRGSLWQKRSAGTYWTDVPAPHVVGSCAAVYGGSAAQEPLTRFRLYKINNDEEWGA